jgi:ABC-type multidrug transport system ATPase subunit
LEFISQKKKKLGDINDKKYYDESNKSIRESSLGGFNTTIEQSITQMMENRISNIGTNIVNSAKQEKMKKAIEKGFQTVIDEYNKIKNAENNNVFLDGLRIVGVSKTYDLSHGKKLKALENIFFDVSRGELLSLLGHNGAGKTTLINALCGNIPISDGYAIINGVNITDENVKSKYKRQLIGLCPQHDILWDELTPYEHIELYASIRNYQKSDIKEIVKIKMKEVNLERVTNDRVSTFSGGMKRRISILLSTVGNPNVVFLDEPSTGLDPVNRRFIWNMIKEIKKKSSVILTTHSMSEAEFLSDRICVIKKGAMQCIGTSLDLKNIYGEGYILTFICKKDCDEQVKMIIQGLSEDINLVSSKGGNLLFSLGFDKIGELNWFIKILNKDFSDEKIKPLKGLIKECGIEQTSIEEIFLKIAKEECDDEDEEEIPNKE